LNSFCVCPLILCLDAHTGDSVRGQRHSVLFTSFNDLLSASSNIDFLSLPHPNVRQPSPACETASTRQSSPAGANNDLSNENEPVQPQLFVNTSSQQVPASNSMGMSPLDLPSPLSNETYLNNSLSAIGSLAVMPSAMDVDEGKVLIAGF
jgi:hypothetical protein